MFFGLKGRAEISLTSLFKMPDKTLSKGIFVTIARREICGRAVAFFFNLVQ